MNVLLWHLHGSWTTAFVQGRHHYLLPVLPDRGTYGLGRAASWDWPTSAVEVTPAQLADAEVDVVVVQRPEELALAETLLQRRLGADVAAVYLEHNTPGHNPTGSRHPLADRRDIPVVHVTHFNAVFWDTGRAPVRVIEHGILDPGERYTGELARSAIVLNDAARRGRAVGADLIPGFAADAPIDLFGMRSEAWVRANPGIEVTAHDLAQGQLHIAMARRRVYLHTTRWTSLGLSLIEAMQLGMPVVVLAATDATQAVDPSCGAISTDVALLRARVRELMNEPEQALVAGKAARTAALSRYGVARFLAEWDALLDEVRAEKGNR